MIRVDVRIDHVDDAHAYSAARLEVWRYVLKGIDDHALTLSAAAEEVRRAGRRRMQELAEDHSTLAWFTSAMAKSTRSLMIRPMK